MRLTTASRKYVRPIMEPILRPLAKLLILYRDSYSVVEFTATQTGKIQTGSRKPYTRVSRLGTAERPLAAGMTVWPTPPTSTLKGVRLELGRNYKKSCCTLCGQRQHLQLYRSWALCARIVLCRTSGQRSCF